MDALFECRHRAFNEPVEGLRASLMHTSGWFLLWLEGTDEAVDTVLRRSSKRLRLHTQPRIVHRSRGAATLTERLTLLSTQWPETPEEFAGRIEAAERADPPLEPARIWARLAEPCALAQGRPPRRVALVAADDTHSIDLVRKLADRFRVPMVYQRFANSDLTTRDVGAAYVDLPIEGEPTRVQVVSRRALGHRMVRESLKDVHRLAVLLGSRPATAIELADSVAGFVDAAPRVPHINLLGESQETAHSITEYLCRKLQRTLCGHLSAATEARLFDILFAPPLQPT
ncbi:MAG TPA: hypothetical protein VIE63_13135 [Ramlibacter sp.]